MVSWSTTSFYPPMSCNHMPGIWTGSVTCPMVLFGVAIIGNVVCLWIRSMKVYSAMLWICGLWGVVTPQTPVKLEDTLNAILFNTMAFQFELLARTDPDIQRPQDQGDS